MDEIQKVLIKAGRKDLAQKYYEKVAFNPKGRNCDECGASLKEEDFKAPGSWSYTCHSCSFEYKHGVTDLSSKEAQIKKYKVKEEDCKHQKLIQHGNPVEHEYCPDCGYEWDKHTSETM